MSTGARRSAEATAVITGGTGGLGKHVSLAFLKAGWQVLVSYVEQDEFGALADAAKARASNLQGVQVDLTQPQGAEYLVEHARREYPAVKCLINLVGGFAGGHAVAQTPEAVWDHMLRLNLKTVFLTCRAAIPALLESGGGAIINVGSRAGVEMVPGMAAYSVSKAGVMTLTQVLAEELRTENIRVNCILPSIIDTPGNRNTMPDADFSKWVKPDAIARVMLFLVSPAGREINGAAIPVYGDA